MKLKATSIAAVVALTAMLVGCSTPRSDAPLKRVSPDYLGAGDIQGIRPMVYGDRTVLEFESTPAFVHVVDENGVQVPFERVGKYVRVARKLSNFSLWFNMSHARFEAAPFSTHQSAPQVAASVPAKGGMPSAASDPQARRLLR